MNDKLMFLPQAVMKLSDASAIIESARYGLPEQEKALTVIGNLLRQSLDSYAAFIESRIHGNQTAQPVLITYIASAIAGLEALPAQTNITSLINMLKEAESATRAYAQQSKPDAGEAAALNYLKNITASQME